MKYFILFLFIVIFQGCFSTINTVNRSTYQGETSHIKQQKALHVQKKKFGLYDIETQTVKNEKNYNEKGAVYSGSIKGIIKSIVYDKSRKTWKYEIEGKDTSHGKLPYAQFYNDKKLAMKGDFVYVILDNSNLKNLFFIKKTNRIFKRTKRYRKATKKAKKKKNIYIGRKKLKLGVPTVENITF